MLRMVSPAGVPIGPGEIAKSIMASFNDDSVDLFKRGLRDYLKVKHIFFVSSGRGGLTLLLGILSELLQRDEVVIPAYTCFSVPSAIVKAGLKIKLCEIDPDTFDFNYAELERISDNKTLCIIPSNLFGLLSNLPEITRIANKNSILVIDDAAQSLGSDLKGIRSGTMGDIGLFSMGRGKIISTYEGGIIVTNSDKLAEKIYRSPYLRDKRVKSLSMSMLFKLFCYSLFIHPRLYWIPHRLPFLELGISKFDLDFTIDNLSRFNTAIGSFMLEKLDHLNHERRKNAEFLSKGLKPRQEVAFPTPILYSYPVYLRFPFLVRNQRLREKIYVELLAHGIGVTKMYPTGVHRIPGISQYLVNREEKFPQTDFVASSILTLPTHPLLTRRDLEVMIEVSNECFNNN